MAGRVNRSVILLTALGIALGYSSAGQQKPAPGIFEIHGSIGQVLKHSDELLFPEPSSALVVQTGWIVPVSGNKDWHRYWRMPSISLQGLYARLGNDEILGHTAAIFPSLRFYAGTTRGFRWDFETGTGIAWASKVYHPAKNPFNNALSTHLSNITQFRVLLSVPSSRWKSWKGGLHLTHFSNGHIRLPNKGINLAGVSIGYTFSGKTAPSSSPDSARLSDDMPSVKASPGRHWGLESLMGVGFTEYSFEGGPHYQTYFTSLAATFRRHPHTQFLLGAEYEFNQSTYQFYYLDFTDRTTSLRRAIRSSVFTGIFLSFGGISVRTSMGFYLPLPRESIISSPFYFKLGLQYTFFQPSNRFRPFVGVLLKSHAAVAQYLAMSTGVTYNFN